MKKDKSVKEMKITDETKETPKNQEITPVGKLAQYKNKERVHKSQNSTRPARPKAIKQQGLESVVVKQQVHHTIMS